MDKIPKIELPNDYWFTIIKKIYESNKTIDAIQLRADLIISKLGIPSGQSSGVGIDKEGNRIDAKNDEIIAEYLTNKAGVVIQKDPLVVSQDFRDIYPDGLPDELKNALNSDTLAIMENEYMHQNFVRKEFGKTEDYNKAINQINYFRLYGGVDLFVRGYVHGPTSHEIHSKYIKESNKFAKFIVIEGRSSKNFEHSLGIKWNDPKPTSEPTSDMDLAYGALMREAVDNGFDGIFTQVDARSDEKIHMDNVDSDNWKFPDLPDSFFESYFDYLKKESPSLTDKIIDYKNLKDILMKQSQSISGRLGEDIYENGKSYHTHSYATKEGNISSDPTGLEMGQFLFSDALSAIKLQMIAKLMTDGYLPKGPIIDYEGGFHTPTKSFFLQNPKYAMEVVLRSLNELMASHVKKNENVDEIMDILKNPNWGEVIKEITKLVFKRIDNNKNIIDVPIDYLETYKIDPSKIMLCDEEISKIMEKLNSTNN